MRLVFSQCILAFLILGRNAPDFSFSALSTAAGELSKDAIWAVFLLGFLGFGVKAGLVPVNFWLPRAYTSAPAIFLPVFAGVTLNLGFYGILRLSADLVRIGSFRNGYVRVSGREYYGIGGDSLRHDRERYEDHACAQLN